MSRSASDATAARLELYDIMRRDTPFQQKAKQVLELGEAYLGVDNAHLTRIDADADYWEAIASTDSADGEFPPGLVLDFQTTYCRRVLSKESSIALSDAIEQGWSDDPAYETHGLHCYHGTPITFGGDPYGTLCFVSEAPRERPFDEADTTFAELIARLLEHELERQRQEAETTRRANSVSVLSRVLRHNLRNDMTFVRGRIDQFVERLDGEAADVDELFASIDRIIALSDKARKLESVVSTQFDREPVALDALLDRVLTDFSPEYSDAEFDVEGDTAVSIDAMPSFELAVGELVENAAKHASPDARVLVDVESTPEEVTLRVLDNGPGLPASEREVLAEGVETPLVHGSGLGLWMVYWIVTSHDGSIDATTEDGTTISVAVPRFTPADGSDPDLEVRKLQRNFDRFQAVFQDSFDAMVIVNDDRRIIDANEHAAELFGRERADLLGRTLGDFSASRFDTDAVWRALQEEGSHDGRFPLSLSDDERIVEYSASADIVPGQHLFIGRDVTERIRRERRFEALSKGFPGLCFIIDEAGIYREILASPASEDRLYADSEELRGRSLEEVLPSETAARFLEEIRKTLDADEVRTVEYDLSVPAGDRHFEASMYPLSESIEGRRAVSMVARDVTDQQ